MDFIPEESINFKEEVLSSYPLAVVRMAIEDTMFLIYLSDNDSFALGEPSLSEELAWESAWDYLNSELFDPEEEEEEASEPEEEEY